MSTAIQSIALSLVAAGALFVAAPADARANHLDPPKAKFVVKGDHAKVKFSFGGHWSPAFSGGYCAPSYGVGWTAPCTPPAPVYRPRVHQHQVHLVYEQVWFAPRYESVITGYSCGKPIWANVCVEAGHYQTAVYEVCGCGQKTFVRYC